MSGSSPSSSPASSRRRRRFAGTRARCSTHLVSLRGELVDASRGATIVATGTHPLARGEGQPLVPLPRYERLREELGERLYTQLVCGLHVHVALPDADTALRAFEGVVPWLPVLLALSANSPFAEGEASGLRSTRAERLLADADRRDAAAPSRLGGVGGGDPRRRHAPPLGRLAAARARDARGARDGPADRRPPLGRLRGDRPGARRGGRRTRSRSRTTASSTRGAVPRLHAFRPIRRRSLRWRS